MNNQVMANQVLIEENALLKQRIQELEQSESERKRATQALQVSEEYFKTIIKNSSDIILILDRLGTITYASSSVERFLGYELDEVIGKRTLDLIVSDDKPRAIADFGRALLTKEVLIPNVFRMRHKNGTERILEGIGNNLIDNPIVSGFVMNVRDITDRKKMEETLRESEERYRALVENASDIVYRMDGTGHITYVNPSGLRVTGYEEEELIGKNYSTLIRPDMSDEAIKFFGRQFVKRIKNTYSEYPILTKDGHEFWLGQNTQLIVEDGQVIGFQAVSRDVTERKQAEIKLRDALTEAQRFREALDHVSSCIYMKDTQSRYVYANRPTLELFGCSAEELVGCDDTRFFPPDAVTRLREVDSHVFLGEQTTEEIDVADAEGGRRVYWEVKTPIYAEPESKTIWGLMGISTDITERKQAEEELWESGKRFRMIVDNARDVIWMLDMNHQFTFMSSAIEQLLGYTVEEYLAKPHSDILVPASLDLLLKTFTEELALAKEPKRDLYGSLTVETEQIHKNGSRLWVELKMNFILDADGKPVGILGFSRDITERKRMEQELQESEKHMRLALEGTNQGLWNLDLVTGKGKITYSDNWHKILGYGPDESHFGYKWWIDQIHPESRPAFEKELLDYMSGHTKYLETEYQIRNKSGEWRWVQALGIFTETDKTGFPVKMSGTLRDITDRKQAEEALRESEERYKNFVEKSFAGVYVVQDGLFMFLNDNASSLSGYKSEELIGRQSDSIVHPADRGIIGEKAKKMLNGEDPSPYEFRIVTKGGQIRWIMETVTSIQYNGRKAILGNSMDITERKRAETIQSDLIEKNPMSIQIMDKEGFTLQVNPSHTLLFGAVPPPDFSIFSDLQNKGFDEFILLAKKGEVVNFPDIYFNVHDIYSELPDKPVWIRAVLFPLEDIDGNPERFVFMHEDITDRKRAEEALNNTYEQVRSLTSRLQEVREETRTKISHDIHDELGGALAGLKMDLLRLESVASGEEDREKRQAMLDIIYGAKELINDTIRSTRRIIMEQRPSVLDDFGLVAAMEWQLGEYKTHTSISFNFNVGQIEIDIDKNLATVVFRIFQEALANVIRHSQATEVYIGLRVDERQLIMEIQDNGRGITEDELTGTGSIGILGMRERALAFGAEINIAGESGKGTTLNLKIPIQ
jgi:PAS domain S-box-containing protein